jgi:hypothetical protein
MRRLTLAALAIFPALAACASSGGTRVATGPTDMQRLQAECDARQGILVPSGRLTGQASLDNVCKINGPTTLNR